MNFKAWDNGRLVEVRLSQPRNSRGVYDRFYDENGAALGFREDNNQRVKVRQDEQGKLYIES